MALLVGRFGASGKISPTHANSIVQLILHLQRLVGRHAARLDEGTVVGGHHGDVGVFPGAELRVVVTRLGVDRGRGGRGGRRCRIGGTVVGQSCMVTAQEGEGGGRRSGCILRRRLGDQGRICGGRTSDHTAMVGGESAGRRVGDVVACGSFDITERGDGAVQRE